MGTTAITAIATVATFIFSALIFWLASLFNSAWPFRWANAYKLVLCILFFLIGLFGHMFAPAGVAALMPEFIPYRIEISYLTGILELAFVVLLWTRYEKITAYIIMVYLALIIPFNIYGWTLEENSPNFVDDPYYLWVRVPLQAVFIALAFYGTRRTPLAAG